MRSSLRAGLVIISIIAAGARRVDADTYPRQPGVSITRYTFDVTLTDASNEIAITEVADIRFTSSDVTSLELDLCGVDPSRKAGLVADPCFDAHLDPSRTGMTVTSVVAGGAPIPFTHHNDRLRLTLPHPSEAGTAFTAIVSYHGTPATGLQIGNNRYGDRGFFSNDWPDLARNWLATIDHPSMKAPVAMTVTAPSKYQVISNGLMVEETDLADGRRKTSWREDVPIPTWQISLGAAPFAVVHFGTVRGVPLSMWVYPQDRDDSFKGFDHVTGRVLDFYSDRIGPYSYEKLAQVEATTVTGGMELASSIFYGYRGVPRRQLVAHEMAHQWFGDSATERDWDDVWLSEGFATYFALLYQEYADGRDEFIAGVRRSAATAITYLLAHPESTIVHDNLADVSKVIANNAQVYQGGAQVLHMLRGVLGEDRFWDGIRLYYSRYRNANASTDDFRRAMEDACRTRAECPVESQNLSWFFHEWLNRGGMLQLAGTWRYEPAARQIVVTFDQTQTTGLYRMPIEIAVTISETAPGASPTTTSTRVWIDQAHTTAAIPVTAEPTTVELDPHVWVTLMHGALKKE